MSLGDVCVRDAISKYGVLLITALLVIAWVKLKWPKLQQFVYKSHLLGFETECARLAEPHKIRLFKRLEDKKSHDRVLRALGRIRVLEIGLKTGNNVPFYPQGTHLIGVDWNRKLEDYIMSEQGFEKFSHVLLENLVIGDGSSLKCIPDSCVDVVVSIRALCSTSSVERTLQEIRRVLMPLNMGRRGRSTNHQQEINEN